MIPVPYYTTVYYICISIITLILCLRIFTKSNENIEDASKNKVWCLLLLLVTILFIGLRDPWGAFEYFGDTRAYSRAFENIHLINVWEESRDIGFSLLMQFSASFMNVSMFHLLCAFLYVFPVYVTFKKWFANLAIYALLIYVVSMSFWAFGINGVRTGLAVSFFIFAIGNVNRKWLMLLFMVLSVSMHKSLLLPIVVFFASFFIKNIKWSIAIWIASIAVCFLAGNVMLNLIEQYLPNIIEDDRASAFTMMDRVGDEIVDNIRFRFDFILYSAVPVFLGWYYIVRKKYNDKFYARLFNTYVLTNAVWIMFFMYAPYTNRYAYLSWCIMPIVMIYPLLKENIIKNQYRFIGYLVLGSLMFTLLMFFR